MLNRPMHPDHDVASAATLAAERYFSPEIFEEEKKRIFSSSWQVIGHVRQVTKPGDFLTFDLQGEPLLVVRGDEGLLRSFYNVCRHRAGNPASGCGNRRLFRCSYHGWTYRLDGALLVTPEFDGVDHFDPRQFGLVPVQVAEWFNLIVVNLDPEAPPLNDHLGEIPALLDKLDFRRMKFFQRRTYDMKCNWKTYVDNYLEGYHLPSLHPGLNRELNYGSYKVETFRQHVRQSIPIRRAQAEGDVPIDDQHPAEDLATNYLWVFPNWMLNCYPGNVSLNMILPLHPERTLAISDWYLPEDELAGEAARQVVEFSHQIQMEDIAMCEIVQKNLHSRSYHSGRYSAKQEKGVHAFHRMYRELMPGS